jgi:predicted DNA-binding protein with PD1-like motif
MLEKQLGEHSHIIVFETGEEVVAGLVAFATEHNFDDAHFTAIGGFNHVTLGYFDWNIKDYRHIPVDEQVEALSLIGDITLKDGKPWVHAHVVLGLSDASARGGHLIKGLVRPTLEVMLDESPVHLQRRFDPESHAALIRF